MGSVGELCGGSFFGWLRGCRLFKLKEVGDGLLDVYGYKVDKYGNIMY